jgi:hypothetical protein
MNKSNPKLILALATTHQVISGERKLLALGVEVEVIPKPQTVRGECGVVLSIPWEQRRQAMKALFSLEVELTNIYQSDQGRLLELDRRVVLSDVGQDGK